MPEGEPNPELLRIEEAKERALRQVGEAIDEAKLAIEAIYKEFEERLAGIKNNFEKELKGFGATATQQVVEPTPAPPPATEEASEPGFLDKILRKTPNLVYINLPNKAKDRVLRAKKTEPQAHAGQRPEDKSSQTDQGKTLVREGKLMRRRKAILGRGVKSEPTERIRKDKIKDRAVYFVGGLVVGLAVGYLATKTGSDPNDLNWLKDIPEFNPDLAEDLRENGVSQPVIERIYENLDLYEHLREADLSQDRIVGIFGNPDLVQALQAPELSANELENLLDNRETFVELREEVGLEPETAAKVLQYPEAVEAWKNGGMDSRLIQAIDGDEELFQWLVDKNVDYQTMKDIMYNADRFSELLEAAGKSGLSIGELQALLADAAKSEAVAASETFWVDRGHGYTQEIKDWAETHGAGLSPPGYEKLHLDLLREFGKDYIVGPEKFRMNTTGGWGLAEAGRAWWAPGVEEHMREALGLK